MKRLSVRVFGNVQGVGFRQGTATQAIQLGVTGWVRNLSNGSVEVVAEGDRAKLDSLLQFLRVGPIGSTVNKVEIAWSEGDGTFTRFDIRS